MSSITKQMVDEAAQKARDAQDEARDIANKYARQVCPLSVGDIVPICGYAHEGKTGKVRHIGKANYDFYGAWQVSCVVLKKDGTESKNVASFSESEWNERERAQ